MTTKEKQTVQRKYQIALRRYFSTPTTSEGMFKLVGIHKVGFIQHIEKYMLDGMTYDNFGKVWSLDHIVPTSLFDFDNPEDLELCYNYNNIMPMFSNDNRNKGGSVHFSLLKLQTLPDSPEVKKLINICETEIKNTYVKYLF
jgi:hypothetical protein